MNTDTAARSMSDHMQRPVCYRDLKTSTQNYIHRVWQETWDQQVLNKLHSIHPSTSHWAALPVRRHDVRLTRLRIGHTVFTHRHLLLGENAPECPSCKDTRTKTEKKPGERDQRDRKKTRREKIRQKSEEEQKERTRDPERERETRLEWRKRAESGNWSEKDDERWWR
ncbi:RNase H domain-containing protein [Trichonephila clavipes]|nr:RNase H domain-containing protein [Trichonephila clavipes]